MTAAIVPSVQLEELAARGILAHQRRLMQCVAPGEHGRPVSSRWPEDTSSPDGHPSGVPPVPWTRGDTASDHVGRRNSAGREPVSRLTNQACLLGATRLGTLDRGLRERMKIPYQLGRSRVADDGFADAIRWAVSHLVDGVVKCRCQTVS